jgi:hypothetical protein
MLTSETRQMRRRLPGPPCERLLQKVRRRGSAQPSGDVSEQEKQPEMSDDKNEGEDDEANELMGSQLSAPREQPRLCLIHPLTE